MERFWVSWYQPSEITDADFPGRIKSWVTGIRCSDEAHTVVALVDAESEQALWETLFKCVGNHIEERFCSQVPNNWTPNSTRFQ